PNGITRAHGHPSPDAVHAPPSRGSRNLRSERVVSPRLNSPLRTARSHDQRARSAVRAPRNDRPRMSTPSPSRRFVLPWALGPATRLNVGAGLKERVEKFRKSENATASMCTRFALPWGPSDPHGHDNTERTLVFEAFDHSGAQRVLHFEHHLVA